MLDQVDYDHYRINHHPNKSARLIAAALFLAAFGSGIICFSVGAYYGRTQAKFICPIIVRLA
jgi:hypothetical protein